MAWIVKPSGTQDIERRTEPYLTQAIKDELENQIIPRYATRQAATLPGLHLIQHQHNWIPFQAMEELAEFLELSAAEVYDTASFYEEFHLHPKGKYLIQICRSISCELCGQIPLMQKLIDKLGVEHGQTTPDGKFTLEHIECLGSCGTAPAVMVEEKLQENTTWEKLEAYIDGLPD